MVTVETYWAKIFVGFKNVDVDKIPVLPDPMNTTRRICSEYVNSVGLCVTLAPTEYVYSTDSDANEYSGEPGVEIGLINYPRFPSEPQKIREQALELARILKATLEQHRVTVMFPDETIMLGEFD